MTIQIWGQNKPAVRCYTKEGKYKQYKSAHYSGHATVDNMADAIKIMQGYFARGWDVEMKVTE